ncbi:MAG TPA: hypothetical protein VML96_08005 [Egibacteraceae bacterium]|nr:hypothetical protein [Egibacteraceae bacterium]
MAGQTTSSGAPPRATPGEDDREEALRPPASIGLAVGIMVGIALAAVVLIIGWVRLAGGQGSAEPRLAALEATVPVELADGTAIASAPAALSAAFDAPVVVAAVRDEPPAGFPECHTDDWGHVWDERPLFHSATVTPEAVTALYVGTGWQDFGIDEQMATEIGPDGEIIHDPAPTAEDSGGEERLGPPAEIQVRCDGTAFDGGWQVQTSVEFGPPAATAQSSGWTCCDADGRATASATLVPPQGASWAVQERGAYWLAYPVGEDGAVRVMWSFHEGGFGGGPAPTHVVYVDEKGVTVDETFLRP